MQTPNTLVSSPDKPRLKPRNLFQEFQRAEERERIYNDLARIVSSAVDDDTDSTEWGYIPPSDSRVVVEEVDVADIEIKSLSQQDRPVPPKLDDSLF